MFAHIDCDCFFVSVELINKPYLKGKPVCVGGPHARGVVVSASYEARPSGIRAGTPVFKAKQMCPEAIFLQGSISNYVAISKQLFQYFHKITPYVEHTSIDEGYLDLTNLNNVYKRTWQQLANHIQQSIQQKYKIPISIGIAPTKTLAKLGSKYNKPFGITVLTDDVRPQILAKIPIDEVCGFGRRLSRKIKILFGINTIAEFIAINPVRVRKALGILGLTIWHELQGVPLKKLTTEQSAPKSILRSAMFPQKTDNQEFIQLWLQARLEEALKKLQKHELQAKGIGIFIRKKHPHTVGKKHIFTEPKRKSTDFKPIIKELLNEVYQPGEPYRAAGIYLFGLSDYQPQVQQLPFCIASEKATKPDVISVLNQCDKDLGKNVVTTLNRLSHKHQKPEANMAFIG